MAIDCPCGGRFSKAYRQAHMKTKAHVIYAREHKDNPAIMLQEVLNEISRLTKKCECGIVYKLNMECVHIDTLAHARRMRVAEEAELSKKYTSRTGNVESNEHALERARIQYKWLNRQWS